MKVIVGSKNIPKRDATAVAFGKIFPDAKVEVIGVDTASGVSSHPTSATEALKGAANRIADALRQSPGADYYVGIEGGLLRVDDRAWEMGWVVIQNSAGNVATGLSAGIEMKGQILQAITDGRELNDVINDIYGISKIGNSNGFYGLATDDLVTRQAAYEQGILFALAQFKHPELFG